jgi:hypothetical protein
MLRKDVSNATKRTSQDVKVLESVGRPLRTCSNSASLELVSGTLGS